jgi:hypothetical protein
VGETRRANTYLPQNPFSMNPLSNLGIATLYVKNDKKINVYLVFFTRKKYGFSQHCRSLTDPKFVR